MKNKNTASILFNTVRENKVLSYILFLLVTGVVVCSLIPPQILKWIVDEYLNTSNETKMIVPALLYLFTIVIVGILTFFKEIVLTKMGQRMTNALRREMLYKIGRMPAHFFTGNNAGAIVSRFTNDVDTIQELFSSGIVSMVIDGLKIIGIVISIFFFSGYLGILVLLFIPLAYLITRYFQKNMLVAQLKNRVLVSRVNNHIPETVHNMEMIHSFSKEDHMENKYKEYVGESYKAVEKVNFYDAAFSPIVIVLRTVVVALMVILCSKQIAVLGITVGMVAAAIELISDLFTPIENLGMELQSIQQAVAGVKRVNEFLRETEENSKNQSVEGNTYTLEFKNVKFGYDKEQILFSNFNAFFSEKETILFKGRTGVGKSTIFKMVLGLLHPLEGMITLNGINVTDISSKEKRRIYGYVEQHFSVVPGDIKQQLTLGDEAVTDEDISRVMKYVGLDDYINSLPQGYNTDMKQAAFSNGQNQLLSIARALVTNPPIILLDEITANLDGETEEKIIHIVKKEIKDRMVLSISHKLSDTFMYDKVVTMDNGIIQIDELK